MISSVLASQKPQQSRLVGGKQAVVQQRDSLDVVLIAGVCSDLKENPVLLLVRPSPDHIHPPQFKISWIRAPPKSDASTHMAQCWKRDAVQVTPHSERTPCVKYCFLPRPLGLKSCLWVLNIICFREGNPAGRAVYKQHLVNGLSLSRPKARWVPPRAVCGDGSQQAGFLGEDSSLCPLATFHVAGDLPWRQASSWLLSDLNPLQAACDVPATAMVLSTSHTPLLPSYRSPEVRLSLPQLQHPARLSCARVGFLLPELNMG